MTDTPEHFTSSSLVAMDTSKLSSALTFQGGSGEPWMVISQDGVITTGPGPSEEEATQRVAKLLAENYSKVHRDQATEIERLSEALMQERERSQQINTELCAALKRALAVVGDRASGGRMMVPRQVASEIWDQGQAVLAKEHLGPPKPETP